MNRSDLSISKEPFSKDTGELIPLEFDKKLSLSNPLWQIRKLFQPAFKRFHCLSLGSEIRTYISNRNFRFPTSCKPFIRLLLVFKSMIYFLSLRA